jgi:FAD/FMN-containing dehydrogenase
MEAFYGALKQKGFEGELDTTDETRQLYSHDASLFEMVPEVVVYPANMADLGRLVEATNEQRAKNPKLSLTARSAGTDMSGGAVNDSVLVDFTKHFNQIEEVTSRSARTQPGVFYRDFEKETLKKKALLPCFPASRELASVGGMVANNSGGEKSLEFGKTENFVTKLDVVLADGKTYTFKALNKKELAAKKAQKNFEGEIYRKMFDLLDKNYDKSRATSQKLVKTRQAIIYGMFGTAKPVYLTLLSCL